MPIDTPLPPTSTGSPAPDLTTYTTAEYAIDLPASWKQIPSPESRAATFQTDDGRAGLFISVDFYVIPPDKARATAERLINSRLADHEKQAPGQVDMFHSGTQSHARGPGLEMYYAAHIAKEDVVMYLVYVMPSRVLNLTLVCKSDRAAAVALFKGIHAHFRPKIAS